MLLLDSRSAIHHNHQQIGGKALGLLKIEQGGQAVPDWCVIPHRQIEKRIKNNKIIFSAQDIQEISSWILKFKDQKIIVRSSYEAEDDGFSSFAGLLESFPNLSEIKDIIEAIQNCYLSQYSDQVNKYLESKGMDQNFNMAVILQVMIKSEKSGVLFTADPKDGSRTQFLISANHGACESIVSGKYDCDEYNINTENLFIQKKIASKTHFLDFCEKGLKQKVTPDNYKNASVLDDTEIYELTKIGKILTQEIGCPLDIEWVKQKNKIHIVQARPITSLSSDKSESKLLVFDNSNIQESFNGLTLPLTFSFATEAYKQVYGQLMRVMGFNEKTVKYHDRRHSQMLGLIKGRVYYNINSWYQGLLLLPSFGKNKEDMESMMGLSDPVDFVTDHKVSKVKKIKMLPQLIILYSRLIISFIFIDRHFKKFKYNFDSKISSFSKDEIKWWSAQKILELYNKLKSDLLEDWGTPIINDFYVMMTTGKVRRTLKKLELVEQLPSLMAGEELESTQPTKKILAIADYIKSNPCLKSELENCETDFSSKLLQDQKLSNLIANYIKKYGDRVPGELKLETRTLRTEKSYLIQILKSYVNNSGINLNSLHNKQIKIRTHSENLVFEKSKKILGHFKTKQLKSSILQMRKAVKYRESMRLDRTNSFGVFRQIFQVLGQKMYEQDLIKNPTDIFYLKTDEIDDFYCGKSFFDNFQDLVDLRKKQYNKWADEHPPQQVLTGFPINELKSKLEKANINQGIGCYPGKIQGQAIVLDNPNLKVNLKDKILVTERTDPGWTPLFLQIKGLLVERGSQLSHSAVVARELGIPTIVNIPGLLQTIQSGDLIHMDGKKGTFERLNK